MTDGNGLPIGCVLTRGNRNECLVFDELLDAALANTGGASPDRLAADRGYSADRLRTKLSSMGIEPVIPYRRTEHVADRLALNERAYRGRNVVERCVGRLKEVRRIGTRYEEAGEQLPGDADARDDRVVPAGINVIRQTVPRVRGERGSRKCFSRRPARRVIPRASPSPPPSPQ